MKFRYITAGIGIISASTFIGLAVSYFSSVDMLFGHSVVSLIAAGGGIMVGYGVARKSRKKKGDFDE